MNDFIEEEITSPARDAFSDALADAYDQLVEAVGEEVAADIARGELDLIVEAVYS